MLNMSDKKIFNIVIKKIFPESLVQFIQNIIYSLNHINEIRELFLYYNTKNESSQCHNPIARCGKKCFSQADEDGITLEILKRINCLHGGCFAELGVGNGLENNTLVLKALGWKGVWIGGENLAFPIKVDDSCFAYIKSWVTLNNIDDSIDTGKRLVGIDEFDVISLDLDGNDYYFVERILERGEFPKLFIVEYNAKFIPPIRWSVKYDADFQWQEDDYFGASLQSFNDLFAQYSYKLVCCNIQSGSNAFFIRGDFSHLFDDISTDINELYVPPKHHHYKNFGFKQSVQTISIFFE